MFLNIYEIHGTYINFLSGTFGEMKGVLHRNGDCVHSKEEHI